MNAGGWVRLLIYSGRPNPEWRLTSNELHELTTRLDKIVHGQRVERPSLPPGGYQGFLVFLDETGVGDPPSFLVFSDTVIEQPGPEARAWADVSSLESWLLEEASRRGFDKQLHALGFH